MNIVMVKAHVHILPKPPWTLTITRVGYQDQDFYYCEYSTNNYGGKSGAYEIYLNVFVQPTVPILGGALSIIETHNNITLTCTVERIRPAASSIYWKIDRTVVYGTTVNSAPDPTDKSLKQINTVSHTLAGNKQGVAIECVVVPTYGTQVSAKRFFDFGDSSTGKSTFNPTLVGSIVGVVVLLLVIVAVLVAYIVRIRKKRSSDGIKSRYITTDVSTGQQASEDVEYNTLNYEEMRPPPVSIESSQGNDSNRVSHVSEYMDPVTHMPALPTSPYEQLSGHYSNETISSGKPYATLKEHSKTVEPQHTYRENPSFQMSDEEGDKDSKDNSSKNVEPRAADSGRLYEQLSKRHTSVKLRREQFDSSIRPISSP